MLEAIRSPLIAVSFTKSTDIVNSTILVRKYRGQLNISQQYIVVGPEIVHACASISGSRKYHCYRLTTQLLEELANLQMVHSFTNRLSNNSVSCRWMVAAGLLLIALFTGAIQNERAADSLTQRANACASLRYRVLWLYGSATNASWATRHLQFERAQSIFNTTNKAYPPLFNGILRLWREFSAQIEHNGNAHWMTTDSLVVALNRLTGADNRRAQQDRRLAVALMLAGVVIAFAYTMFVLWLVRDRIQTEHQQRKMEAEFTVLFENLPEPLLILRSGLVALCNTAAVRLLGYSHTSELLGLKYSDFSAASQEKISLDVESSFVKLEAENKDAAQLFKWVFQRPTGEKVPVQVTIRPVVLGGSNALMAMLHDLTEAILAQETILASERRLYDMVENLPVGAVLVEGELITVNRMVEELTGYSRSELETLNQWFDNLYGDRAEETRSFYEANRQSSHPGAPVRSLIRKDGVRRLIQFSAFSYAASEVWILQDITERLDAEQASKRLSAILEATPDFVGSSTVDGQIFYGNSAFQKLWGESGLVPLFIQDCVTHDVYKKLRRIAMPTAAKYGIWQGEAALLAGDGRNIPVSAVVIAHRNDEGNVAFYSTIARDISARLQIENKLRMSEALLAEAQQVAHMGSYEFSYTTRQIVWSDEVYRLFDRDPALGVPSHDEVMAYYHPEDSAALKAARVAAFKTNGTYELDIRIRQRNGSYRWCRTNTRAIADENGRPLRIVGTLIDITSSKVAQEQAQSTNEWLEETNKQLIEQQATVMQMHTRMEEQIMVVNEQAAQLEYQKAALEQMNGLLQALATTDGLTGIANHRAFQERLAEEWLRCERYNSPFSVILLDVDKFKTYNDAYGHPEGDTVLKTVAQTLKAAIRDVDMVARYGGEEFVILLPETGVQGAQEAAERCRVAIEAAEWPKRPVTASFGAATVSVTITSAQELVDSADKALYASKEQGRNRVTHIQHIVPCPSVLS